MVWMYDRILFPWDLFANETIFKVKHQYHWSSHPIKQCKATYSHTLNTMELRWWGPRTLLLLCYPEGLGKEYLSIFKLIADISSQLGKMILKLLIIRLKKTTRFSILFWSHRLSWYYIYTCILLFLHHVLSLLFCLYFQSSSLNTHAFTLMWETVRIICSPSNALAESTFRVFDIFYFYYYNI